MLEWAPIILAPPHHCNVHLNSSLGQPWLCVEAVISSVAFSMSVLYAVKRAQDIVHQPQHWSFLTMGQTGAEPCYTRKPEVSLYVRPCVPPSPVPRGGRIISEETLPMLNLWCAEPQRVCTGGGLSNYITHLVWICKVCWIINVFITRTQFQIKGGGMVQGVSKLIMTSFTFLT